MTLTAWILCQLLVSMPWLVSLSTTFSDFLAHAVPCKSIRWTPGYLEGSYHKVSIEALGNLALPESQASYLSRVQAPPLAHLHQAGILIAFWIKLSDCCPGGRQNILQPCTVNQT